VIINKSINLATGQDTKDMAFTEQNWGKVTCSYLTSIEKMPGDTFDLVAMQVLQYAQNGHFTETHGSDEEEEEEECAALIEFTANCMCRTMCTDEKSRGLIR